jgi:hypothetical protein
MLVLLGQEGYFMLDGGPIEKLLVMLVMLLLVLVV